MTPSEAVTLADVGKRVENIERNQELLVEMVQLILKELALRKEILELDKEMEATIRPSSSFRVGRE